MTDRLPHAPSRRRVLAGLAASVPALGALTAPPAAATGRRGRVVRVDVTARGVRLSPSTVPAGPVTFEMSTPESESMAPGVLRLSSGVVLSDYLDHYRMANSTDPAVRREGTALIDREATYFGGGTVTAVAPLRVTTFLEPGRHHVFNYVSVLTPYLADSVRELTVTGHGSPAPPLLPESVLALHGRGPGSRYLGPEVLPARGGILVSNFTGQLNEAMFIRVPEGTTETDARAFFDAAGAGRQPPVNILLTQPEGMAPLTPGRSAVLGLDLSPGPYVVLCFLVDRTTGTKGAFEGLWKLVTLR